MTPPIDRKFFRLPRGLVHLRQLSGGEGIPLIMLHASPGSSKGLVPLLGALGECPRAPMLAAPDMPGNGDSDPFTPEAPDVGWYADALIELLDTMGVGGFDLYGTHTGARIGVEIAARHPSRVRRAVIDGLIAYEPEMRDLLLERYAPQVEPDDHGRHLIWAFHYIRDQVVHFPHFMRDPEHRLMTRAMPSAADLHDATMELLKGLGSYHKAYHAAFRYDARQRLPDLKIPTLMLLAEGELPDLRAATAGLAALVPDGRVAPVGREPAAKAAVIAKFLGW